MSTAEEEVERAAVALVAAFAASDRWRDFACFSERETIIFHRYDSDWLAVHEHLSPEPGARND